MSVAERVGSYLAERTSRRSFLARATLTATALSVGPIEFLIRPATAYAAQFIGHTNLLKGEVRGGVVHCGRLTWSAGLPDGPALFSLRPENIRLGTSSASVAGSVQVGGKVIHQAFHGATELIRVECGNGLVLVVRTPTSGGILDEVEVEFSSTDAVLLRESPERI